MARKSKGFVQAEQKNTPLEISKKFLFTIWTTILRSNLLISILIMDTQE